MHLPYTKHCYVCGAQNPHGLGLRFRQVAAEVHADFTPAPHHTGFRDIIHGGIIATVLDEAMFWAAATVQQRFCLAAELNVRFLRKVSVGNPYHLIAKFEIDRGRVWESSAVWQDAAGQVCARATCKQMPMDDATTQHAAVDFLPDPTTIPVTTLFPGLAI